MPYLRFVRGDQVLLQVELKPGRTVVGRADSCDVSLGSDSVSREHCVFQFDGKRVVVADRSRFGTSVNGARLTDRRALADGDELKIGIYTAAFVDAPPRPLLPTVQVARAAHEELVEADEARVVRTGAVLCFHEGPRAGETVPLTSARTTLGGPGAAVVLDDALPRDAAVVRLSRGHALLEPGDAKVRIDGVRQYDLTPVEPRERISIGAHVFSVEAVTLDTPTAERDGVGGLLGDSEAMRPVHGWIARLATVDDPVLLLGETGTGKEVTAQTLHEAGPRREGPFVAVNCAGLTDALFESTLFGHVKGAFTGATETKDGCFHDADGGTLFLDELGELRLDLQAKLLRVLQNGEVRRVGASAAEYPDVRVVAATNRDLVAMIRAGAFRSDLYYRLERFKVRLPPVRERLGDVPLLVRALLARESPGARFSDAAVRALQEYDWPGNVRELGNVVRRAAVMVGNGRAVEPGDLSFERWSFVPEGAPPAPRLPGRAQALADQRQEMLEALRRVGSKSGAAQAIGVKWGTFRHRLNVHQITDDEWKRA